jgi:replicative DNA helicase
MSSSPDPRGPDATVTDLASAAVLGALLWDPRRVRDVMDWLEPADFPRATPSRS